MDARVSVGSPCGLQHHPGSQQKRRRREAEQAQPLEQGGGGVCMTVARTGGDSSPRGASTHFLGVALGTQAMLPSTPPPPPP